MSGDGTAVKLYRVLFIRRCSDAVSDCSWRDVRVGAVWRRSQMLLLLLDAERTQLTTAVIDVYLARWPRPRRCHVTTCSAQAYDIPYNNAIVMVRLVRESATYITWFDRHTRPKLLQNWTKLWQEQSRTLVVCTIILQIIEYSAVYWWRHMEQVIPSFRTNRRQPRVQYSA